MNVKIGAIIKRLRTDNHITQDALATAIGVTPQAISRWEAEGGYPDIELLPALADFFAVSTDELLGYKLSEREEELARIKKEMRRLAEVGTHQEKLSFVRDAFVKFPNDSKIKVYLAACLIDLYENTRETAHVIEAEKLCLSVIDVCHDEDIRYGAITTLNSVYIVMNKIDRAKETLDLLAPMKCCRETALACGIGDGNTECYIQDEIDKFTDGLGLSIHHLVLHEDLPDDPSTWDKKTEMLTVSNQLYTMIYGDNLMFYHTRLAQNYWLISTYQMSQGKAEDALASLEKMCHHAVEYDKSYMSNHGKMYTSIFTDKLVYPEPSKDFHELTEHTNCYYMLDRLQHKRYNPIREDARFKAVIHALQEYAK